MKVRNRTKKRLKKRNKDKKVLWCYRSYLKKGDCRNLYLHTINQK